MDRVRSPHTLPVAIARHFRKRDVARGAVTEANVLNLPLTMVKNTVDASVTRLKTNIFGPSSAVAELTIGDLVTGRPLFVVDFGMSAGIDQRTARALEDVRKLAIRVADKLPI